MPSSLGVAHYQGSPHQGLKKTVASASAFVLTIGGLFLGQSFQATVASADQPTTHSATAPVWTAVTNWKAVWDQPLTEDVIYYSLDAADPMNNTDRHEDLLWESYDWSDDMSTYKTRVSMHWEGDSAGQSDFSEYQFSSMAVGRIGGKQTDPNAPLTAYFWSRDARQVNGPASCEAGYTPIVRTTSGESEIYWSCMPAPKGEGNVGSWPSSNGDSLFSGAKDKGHATGGEIEQYTGNLYVVSSYLGEIDSENSESSAASSEDGWRFSVWNPVTGEYSLSGAVQPGDWYEGMGSVPKERLAVRANVDGVGDATPYAPADFALDADGNVYLYSGGGVTHDSNGNMKLVRMEPARDSLGNIVDGSADNPWRYYVVSDIKKEIAGEFWDNAGGQYGTWGNAFLDGQLLNGAGTRTYGLPADAPDSADACQARSYMNSPDRYADSPVPGPSCTYDTDGVVFPYPGTSNMVKIDPLSATAKIVYSVQNDGLPQAPDPISSAARDNASAQGAMIIRGTLWNDANADGVIQASEEGLADQQVGLYDASGVLRSVQETGATGTYSFLTSGVSGVSYYVRPIQVQIDGVNAVQTWAAGFTDGRNSASVACASGAVTSSAGGACEGAISPYSNSDPTVTALGVASDKATWLNYATVTMGSSNSVPSADFGFTTTGSYGDAAAGPAEANVPSHINGVSQDIQLGADLGSYAGPATDNASHNATDDGVSITGSALGSIALQDGLFAATHDYNMTADLAGDSAGEADVTAWTTTPGANVWTTSANSWSPTATAPTDNFQVQPTGAISGTQSTQLRVSASTATASVPDNSLGEYSGTADSGKPWATVGEIEDYSFGVTDAVYRPAVVNASSTSATFTIAGQTLTADAASGIVQGAAAAAAPGQLVSVTGTADSDIGFRGVTVTDTTSGQAVDNVTVTPAADGKGATVTFTEQVGDDYTVLFTYGNGVDSSKSSLVVDRTQQVVGGDIVATITARDKDGNIVPNVQASFKLDDADGSAVVTPASCVTGVDGTCQVLVTDSKVETVTLHGLVNGQEINNPDPAQSSPQDLTFVADSVDHATLEASPAGPLVAGEGQYTLKVTAFDKNDNPVSGATVVYQLDKVIGIDGSALDESKTSLSNQATCVTGADGSCSDVKLSSTDAGKFVVSATANDKATDPKSVTLEFITGDIVPEDSCDPSVPADQCTRLVVKPTALPVSEQSTATAYVTDKWGNEGADVDVTFTVDGNGYFVAGGDQSVTDSTDDLGAVAVKLSDKTAETVTVKASYADGADTGLVGQEDVVFGVGQADHATFVVEPEVDPKSSDHSAWQVVDLPGGESYYTGILTVFDADNNPIPGLSDSTIDFAANDPAVTISDITAGDQPGSYQVHYSSKVASADYTSNAMVDGLSAADITGHDLPIPFKADEPYVCNPDQERTQDCSRLEVTPKYPETVGVSDQDGPGAKGIAYINDKFGNPVEAGWPVDFQLTDSPAAIMSPVDDWLTDDQGQAEVKVTDAQVETVKLHALINGEQEIMNSPQLIDFVHGKPDAGLSSLTVDPGRNPAGTDVKVTATIEDELGNRIVDLTRDDFVMSGATEDQVPDLADASFRNFAAVGDGVYTFNVTSKLVGDFVLQAIVDDVTLDDHPGVEFYAGEVCVDNCEPIDNPETPEVDESKDNYTDLMMIKNDAWANGQDSDEAVGHAYDHYGNIVSGAVFTVTDATVTPDLLGALTPKVNTATTDASGTASMSWTSKVAGNFTGTATVQSANTEAIPMTAPATDVNSIRFIPGDVSAEKSSMTIAPASPLEVGSVYTATIHVVDDNLNPLNNVTATFSLGSANDSATQAIEFVGASTCSTDADGNCSVDITSQFANVYKVHGKVPTKQGLLDVQGGGDPAKASPQDVEFTAGPVCNENAGDKCTPIDNPDTPEVDESENYTKVTVYPNGAVADGQDQDGINIETYDRYGNPVAGAEISLSTNDPVDLSATQVTTGPDGKATVTATSKVADIHEVTVSEDGKPLPGGDPAELSFVPDKGLLDLTIKPETAQEVGAAFTITAKVADDKGNAIAGAPVTFTLPELVTMVGDAAPSCTTSAQGACSIAISSIRPGEYTIKGSTGDATDSVDAEFVAGPPDASKSTVVVTKNGANFDGVDRDIAKVTVRDRYDNLLSGIDVSSTPVVGQSSGLTVQSDVAPTNSLGETEIWYTSTEAGDKLADVVVEGSNGPITPSGSPVTISFGKPACASCSDWAITPAGPLTVGVDADSAYTMTATIRDTNDELVYGAVVTFGVDPQSVAWGDDQSLQPAWGGSSGNSCTTDDQGVCSVTVTSTRASTFNFTAMVSNQQIGVAQTRVWTPGKVDADHSKVWIEPEDDNQKADGKARIIAQVEANDKYGNPVSGQAVVSAPVAGDSNLTVQSDVAVTDTKGHTTIWYTSTQGGQHQANVYIGADRVEPKFPGKSSPVTMTFTQSGVSAEHSNLVVEPKSTAVGELVTATVTARSVDDILLPGVEVSFSLDSETGQVHPGSATFDELVGFQGVQTASCVTGTSGDQLGVCSVTFTDPEVEKVDIHATVDEPQSDGQSVTKEVADSPQTVTFTEGCVTGSDPQCPNPPEWVDPDKRTNVQVTRDDQKAGPDEEPDIATARVFDYLGNPVDRDVSSTAEDQNLVIGDVQRTEQGVYEIPYTTKLKTESQFEAQVFVDEWEIVYIPKPGSALDNPAGIASMSSPVTVHFTDLTKPNPPEITKPGDNTLTNDSTPDISGTADEPGNTIIVKDEDGNTLCTTTVEGTGTNGTWSCTPEKPMADGPHVITATQTDDQGQVSPPSNAVHITIDTTAPNPPVIDHGNGDEIGGTIRDSDDHPLDPGTIVTVRDEDGNEICTAEVVIGDDGNGTWSCLTPDGTPSGPINAIAQDPAGNVSDPSDWFDLDTTPPTAPPADSNNGSEVGGKGDPGDTIDVKGPDGKPVDGCQDVPIDDAGNWVCTPTRPLNPGDRITVTETDPAGNVSEPTTVIVGSLGIEFQYPQRQPGEPQGVTGTNFNPGEKVCLTIDPGLEVGCQTADENGTVHFQFDVPKDFANGSHTGTLTGAKSGQVRGSFMVTTISVRTGGYADTSSDLSLRGLAAGLVVATVGVWIGVKSRRRVHAKH